MGSGNQFRSKIELVKGDITGLRVDAIVNAANTDLILGSGVAGAIRRAAGDCVQAECNEIGSIPLGDAVITSAGGLKAKYVIHAAGMHLGRRVTEQALHDATLNSLKRAQDNGVRTIAFPAIGTGVGGLNMARCAEVMLGVLREFFLNNPTPQIEKVYFVLFDDESLEIFKKTLDEEQL